MTKEATKPKPLWTPTIRQEMAMVRTEDEILYGGARGGGKTDAGMVWLTYWIDNPKYRALVIRRNVDDLKDWIDRASRMYMPYRAVFSGQPVDIKFPSGAIIRTGHLRDENAYTKYQGHEYQKILIEELTHIPRESDYEKLLGSNRSLVAGIKPQVFATTNPDGDGHEWVKARFGCENPEMVPIENLDKSTGITIRSIFIPAKVEDNPHLVNADPRYVAWLNQIKDPVLQRQWREGSWEEPLIEGAYYKDQLAKVIKEERITNVSHENKLKVNTNWDLGMNDSMAIWFDQEVGTDIRLINYFEGEGEGLLYYIKELRRLRDEEGYIFGVHRFPHDIEVRELGTGKSRKEVLISLGMTNIITNPRLPIEEGIDATRRMFDKCWFDKEKTKEGLNALKHYKKEFDDKRNTYKNKPYHNWASNGADAFRTLSMGRRDAHLSDRIGLNESEDPELEEFRQIRETKRLEREGSDPIDIFD